jgi:hypothetical protein
MSLVTSRMSVFLLKEAAKYPEVSMPAFRRYVQSGKVIPAEIVGRSQLFTSGDLQNLKNQFYSPSLS